MLALLLVRFIWSGRETVGIGQFLRGLSTVVTVTPLTENYGMLSWLFRIELHQGLTTVKTDDDNFGCTSVQRGESRCCAPSKRLGSKTKRSAEIIIIGN
jgi:hypothetical protein